MELQAVPEMLTQGLVPTLPRRIQRQEAPFLRFTESQGRALVFHVPSSYMPSKRRLVIALSGPHLDAGMQGPDTLGAGKLKAYRLRPGHISSSMPMASVTLLPTSSSPSMS